MNEIELIYKQKCKQPSDINEHLPTLYRYAQECDYIVEFGVRWVVSTWAFLNAKPKKLLSYDVTNPAKYGIDLSQVKTDTDFKFIQKDVLKINPIKLQGMDLLFLDTWHVANQMEQELKLFGNIPNKYLIFHDTDTFWDKGENRGYKGIGRPILDFLANNKHWQIEEVYHNNNGLLILKRS